jgi:hypothetical protein
LNRTSSGAQGQTDRLSSLWLHRLHRSSRLGIRRAEIHAGQACPLLAHPEIARIYAWIGQADPAFEWLEKSTPANRSDAIFYLREPTFAKLHTDPRWHALLERLGLAPEQLAAIEFKIKLPK